MIARRYLWAVCAIMCLSISTLFAQSRREEKKLQKKQAVYEQIKSVNYKIEVSRAYPLRHKSVILTSPYSVEIRNDSIISTLPYYGRAYTIPYGGGKGLMFEAPIDSYEVEYNEKKGDIEIKINARTNEDKYDYTLNVFSNGSSRINVNMQNRESISYSGELNLTSF